MSEIRKRGWAWAAVPIAVITSDKLKPVDVRVYGYMLWRAGDKGIAWPGVSTIAKDLKISERLVKLALSRLHDEFWINRFRRVNSSSVTVIYENPEECLCERATGCPTVGQYIAPSNGQQVAPLNDSKRNNKQKNDSLRARKPRAPPPTTHPAIVAFRDAAHTWPHSNQRDTIVQAVGDEPEDVARWQATVGAYVMLGWNKYNVAGMLDYFKRRQLPASQTTRAHSETGVDIARRMLQEELARNGSG